MQAFHGQEEVKQKYLGRVIAHREADNIIQGTGWENGKGCAVGCTLEAYEHGSFEKELGIPEWLAHLEDTIFEGMENKDAVLWPERFLGAIPVGFDRYDEVKRRFLIFVLKNTLEIQSKNNKFDKKKFPDVHEAVKESRRVLRIIIKLHESGCTDENKWSAAESAARSAWSAARSAESAAMSAARSAAWSARSAWSAAESAESAAESAESAARSAESAAESAESAARSAWSAARSAESAESAAFKRYADQLLKIIGDVAHG